MLEYLFDQFLQLGLIIIGIILLITIISAIPFAILHAVVDKDEPQNNSPKIKRTVKDANGNEYEKSYPSDDGCEHEFDSRKDVSRCKLFNFIQGSAFIGLIVGIIMSYFGDFAIKTISISLIAFIFGTLSYRNHKKEKGNNNANPQAKD